MPFEPPIGATPIDDIDGLIPDGIETMGDLSAVEAENILLAMDRHLTRRKSPDSDWLDESFVRALHRDMFDRVWSWAGTYRGTELSIGRPAAMIREEVARLCEDVSFWRGLPEKTMPILERASRLHHKLVRIHPFKNGNGRHARLLADIFLRSYGRRTPIWPGGIGGSGADREAYISALKRADEGDYEPLVAFTRRFLPKS